MRLFKNFFAQPDEESLLEKLEADITEIDHLREWWIDKRSSLTRKTAWFGVLSVFVGVAFMATAINVLDASASTKLYILLCLISAPVLSYIFCKLVNGAANFRLKGLATKRQLCCDEQSEILARIVEKNKYKTTQNLLRKYTKGNSPLRNDVDLFAPSPARVAQKMLAASPDKRKKSSRNFDKPDNVSFTSPPSSPTPSAQASPEECDVEVDNIQQFVAPPTYSAPPPSTRTTATKVLDFLIGEGPNNRFAMICEHCFGHNGLAIANRWGPFKCCYCQKTNPGNLMPTSASSPESDCTPTTDVTVGIPKPRLRKSRTTESSDEESVVAVSPNNSDNEVFATPHDTTAHRRPIPTLR